MRCWLSCFDFVEVRGIGAKERSDIDRLSIAKVDVTWVDRSNGAFGCRLRCGRTNHHGFLQDVGDGCHRRGLEQRAASLHWRKLELELELELEPESKSECESECERLGPVLKEDFTFATR